MKTSIFKYYNGSKSILIKNLKNFCIIEVDKNFLNLDKQETIITNENLKKLNSLDFFETINQNEEILDFVIVTNTDCNLKCSYCYESGIKKYEKININDEQIFNFIQYNISKYPSKNVSVEFTGGEPINNFEYIYKLVNLLKINFPDRKFKYSIITNGTLIEKEHLNFFDLNNFSMQLSLDGSKKFHNNERKGKDFFNTYDLILNNIKLILREFSSINLSVRINVSNKNSDSIINLIEELNNAIIPVYRSKFFLYFDFVDVPQKDVNYIVENEKYDLLMKLYFSLYKSGFELSGEYVIGGNCMIKNNNSVTILPNGDLIKCYSLVDNENYVENKLSENCKIDIADINPLVTICNNYGCSMYYLCKGGCPYKEYVKIGSLNKYCNPKLIEMVNKILFVFKLNNYGLLSKNIDSIDDLIEEYNNVQIHKICF